jgi:hypothetical protein
MTAQTRHRHLRQGKAFPLSIKKLFFLNVRFRTLKSAAFK